MKKVKLWDAPIRIFHWSLAGLVAAAFVTGLAGGGLMSWHGTIGAAIAALVGFRLAWGIVGSTPARFASFVAGPRTVLSYLRGNWQGVGHNPLGALSVLAMLAALAVQVTSGLASNDDIAFQGPYHALVGEATAALALLVHKRLWWLIALLVALHLGAILFYARVRGENLVTPMLTGVKELPPAKLAAAGTMSGGGRLALVVALLVASLVGWAAAGGPVDWLAPPPAPVSTPDW